MKSINEEKKHKGDLHSDGVHVHFRTPSKLFVRPVRFSLPFYISKDMMS